MRLCLLLLLCLPFCLLAQSDSALLYRAWDKYRGVSNGDEAWDVRPVVDIYGDHRHFLSVGTGMLTPDFLLSGYHVGKPVTRDYENHSPRLVYFVNYKYRVGEGTLIGITATYEQQYGDWLHNEVLNWDYDLKTTVKGAFQRSCATIAVEMSTDYKEEGIMRVYFSCGAGITYLWETDQYLPEFYNQYYKNGVNELGPIRRSWYSTHFNGHISPVGFKVGRKLCYFVEVGFGYKGVICSGLTYRFDKE